MSKKQAALCLYALLGSSTTFAAPSDVNIEHRLNFIGATSACTPNNVSPVDFSIDVNDLDPINNVAETAIDVQSGVITFSNCTPGQSISIKANNLIAPIPGSPVGYTLFQGEASSYFAINNQLNGDTYFSPEDDTKVVTIDEASTITFLSGLIMRKSVEETRALESGNYSGTVSYTITPM